MKRTAVVIAGGALAALTACAPAGSNPDNAAGVEPVAQATGEPSAEPTAAAAKIADVDFTDGLVARKLPRMGRVVTDDKGWVLYRFDEDSAKPPTSNCVDKCAQIWPPAVTDGAPRLQGVTDEKIGTVTRQDGSKQITIGGWPVYRYIGDRKPGQWRGQGVAGTWFVVAPDGRKNLTCLPTGTPKPVAPPAAAAPAADEDSSGDSGGYSY